jgi:hypothetical protein
MSIGRLLLLLVVLSFALILSSCVGTGSRTTTHPDGTVVETNVYAQVGGRSNYLRTADGSIMLNTDLDKSFGQLMTAAGAAYSVGAWAGAETAKTTANAATAQTSIKSAARVEETAIKATGAAATSLGNNPEANVGAINAVGGLFKR